jgi:hypothetical protein
MAGNYGGNSTPTTPIGGDMLFNGRNTTYVNYKCTTIVASADTSTFTYEGALYTLGAAGATVNLIIDPPRLTALPVGVWFTCYDCSCSGVMTGTTSASSVTYTGSPMYAPTIIGSGGLNS